MKMSRLPILAVFLLAAIFAAKVSSKRRIVCYYGSWAVYRPGNGKFDVENIDPTLCTHVIYSFVGVGQNGGVVVLDPWNDLSTDGGKGAIGRFTALRNRNPNLKVIVAIGGWNQGSTTFSSVVNNVVLRGNFVRNILEFVKIHGFDGFDLDWEYPNQRGGIPSDKESFILLIRELRQEFNKHGLSLSAAVPASRFSLELSYEMAELGKYLDFINVMTYDMHGSWESVTGHNAPLYASSSDKGDAVYLNVNSSILYWLEKGIPSEKIIMGVPLYGRTWTLKNQLSTGIGAPATGPGEQGPYTQEAGILGYNEICRLFQMGEWTKVRDVECKVPFAFKNNQWVSYDDVESIKTKTAYAIQKNLGGIMVWSIETDDFLGTCSGVKFPLLVAINTILNSENNGNTGGNTNTGGGNTNNGGGNTNNGGITTKPQPPPTVICTRDGYTRDPYDCAKFYYCQLVGSTYIKYPFSCAPGLAYDKQLQVCNYRNQVNCS